MACVFKNEKGEEIGKRINAYNLDPREVVIMPELNGRHDLPEIQTLIADILSKPDGKCIKGQTTPVIIRKDGTKPVLVAGHRRLRAILEINKKKLAPGGEQLPLLCSYMQLTPVEALAVAVTENRERSGVTPLDEAYCIKQYLRLGKDYEFIAIHGGFFPELSAYSNGHAAFPGATLDESRVKKAIAWVKRREKLLGLDEVAQKALSEGKIKPSAAEHLAELESSKQRDLIEKGSTTAKDIARASGKPEKITLKTVREELDGIISDWATKLPREVADLLEKLRDRI
jgi:ParB-like chromosome segregation protein Spo0J